MEADAGEYIKNYLHSKSFPRISLHCKQVPVQYWEYEYGLLVTDNYKLGKTGLPGAILVLARHKKENVY